MLPQVVCMGKVYSTLSQFGSLELVASALILYIIIVATEIFLAFKRVPTWIQLRINGYPSEPAIESKRERRASVPHIWAETKVESNPSPDIPKRINTPEDELRKDLLNGFCKGELENNNIFNLAQSQKPSLIFSTEYTRAMDEDWHSGHFCCWNCDLSLVGHRYILRDDHPFCIKCYENLFANTCEECKAAIGTDSKDLSYKEKHWHEHCFKCIDCQKSLVDQPFASKDEKLYCADCYDNNFAARCDGCTNIFRAGMKKFEFRGKQWHEGCFCCSVCKQPIGNKRFIPRDQEFVCVPCYEEQFAQRCEKCAGVINRGGITYKTRPFHRDCFTCTNCNRILAGEKFTSREEQPYCADCFGELFAKKCCRCVKPITGLGGTKFISFDDRHWHSDCFGCYKCAMSLVGRGFLTNGDDILCPECGKNI